MAILPTKAISHTKLRQQTDKAVAERFRLRLVLDQRRADQKLQRELREVWE